MEPRHANISSTAATSSARLFLLWSALLLSCCSLESDAFHIPSTLQRSHQTTRLFQWPQKEPLSAPTKLVQDDDVEQRQQQHNDEGPSSRRMFMASGLLATGALLVGDKAVAQAAEMATLASGGTDTPRPIIVSSRPTASLPWIKNPLNPKRSSMRLQDAESLGYNLSFVTYLSRFLLNFDPSAQQWWIDGAQELSKSARPREIFAIRQAQFSKFSASVELGLLQDYGGDGGPARLLQSLLDRYTSLEFGDGTAAAAAAAATSAVGDATVATNQSSSSSINNSSPSKTKQERLRRETKEARRQLALLFGLLPGESQPTKEITKLLASVDNGSLSSQKTIQTLQTDEALKLLRGFAPGILPTVVLSPPQAGLEGYEQATVEAVMKPTGELLRLELDDQQQDPAVVFKRTPTIAISVPKKKGGGRGATAVAQLKKGKLVGVQLTDAGQGYALGDAIEVRIVNEGVSTVSSMTIRPVLEMAIQEFQVVKPGTGYAVERPIWVTLAASPDGKGVGETVGVGYPQGERGSFTASRVAGDDTVRDFERGLGKGRDIDGSTVVQVSGATSGGSLPTTPFSSKASSSQQLLSLLPQGFGLGYDTDKKKYFLTVDQEFKDKYPNFATQNALNSNGRLVPDFGPRGESPIERDMNLDLPTFLRFCLSGAICSSGVHLALTPLDVVKTKVQTNPTKYPKIGSSFSTIWRDEGPGTFFTGWAPTLMGNFLGGAVLYAMTELIRRSLTQSAGINGDSLEVFIILTAAGISAATAATVYCPFEAVRIRTVAQPDFGSNSFEVVSRMIKEEGIGSLTDAIPIFLVKQVPYACVKFTIFDLSTEYLFRTYPTAQEDLKFSLLISLVGGVLGGVAAAVVSNPADTIISELKKAKSDQSPQDALQALLDRAGVSALFKGLPLRMVFYSLAASLQFAVFDGVRFALGIGPDDLRVYLDVLGGALTEKGTIV